TYFAYRNIRSCIGANRSDQILDRLKHVSTRRGENLRTGQIYLELISVTDLDRIHASIAVVAHTRRCADIRNKWRRALLRSGKNKPALVCNVSKADQLVLDRAEFIGNVLAIRIR